MALLTAQPTTITGLQPTFTAVNASDTFVPAANRILYVKNTNAATRTVTITTARTGVGGAAVADWSGTIAATTGELVFGGFPYDQFADAATNVATVTYSATTNVTAALIEITAS
jgi:hypothetical protein